MSQAIIPGVGTRAYRNIQRNDWGGCHGWTVRLVRRGELQLRYFPDQKWGGRRAALRVAIEYRDDQLLALYPPLRIRRFFPKNTTGVVGVFVERRRQGGRLVERYCASWPVSPRQVKRRHFSVKKHGKRRAFKLAVEARRLGVEELERRVRGMVAAEVVRRRDRRGRAG